MRRKFFAIVLLLFIALTLLYSMDPPKKNPSATEGKQVLIAYEKTRFKNALIEHLQELLNNDSIIVKVVEHSKKKLDQYNAADYNAIFITNSGVNSKVRPWIVAWLKKNIEYKKNILLHTTQKSNWKVKTEVEAVTSASSISDVQKLAIDYFAKIKAKYNDAQVQDNSIAE